ncbi:MAG: molybdopterin-dependent oxidoreductase [Alphaproteobacteria bacterium]|nr:molybdopterin-dependent oxidoreductase [Alphaproteobacteria bacterium]
MADTRTIQTMCPMNCHPTLCGMKVTLDDDQLLSIEGDPDNPDSQGFLCMRGNAAHQIVGNDQRLLRPMVRETSGTGDWTHVGWDAALDRIAGHMQAVGREAVGFWQSHGNAVNDYGVGLKRGQMDRFANLYGCQRWDPGMICWGLGAFGLGLTGAIQTSTKEDMGANSEMIVLWGANSVSQANTIKHVEAAKRRGARIVVIDVRRTEASALADDVYLVRPGSDAALALAMMHVIVADGTWDRAFVESHTVGFDALRAHLGPMTPAWAAERTGVSAERIVTLARSYAATRPAMIIVGGSSVHKGANIWEAARAIGCLPALTGNFGAPGGGIGPRHGARSFGAGFCDIRAADRRLPGSYVPNQMEAVLEALEDGTVKVLFLLGSSFLSAFPDTNRALAALRKAELVVAYDIFPNQVIREAAHVVLPGTIWLEEIGAKATNTHVYLSDRALPAAGEARPLYTLYQELADRLNVDDVYPWADQEAALNEVLDHPATGHATVDSMRANGGRAALKISHVAYPDLAFDTPSGKIEFLSERAGEMGLPTLPVASAPPAQDGLALAHGRTFAHFHAFYDHARALPTLAAREVGPELWVAPEDAAARAIGDGDAIEISSELGTFTARAKVTKRMHAGAVWMRDGWPGQNALIASKRALPDTALEAFPFSVGQSTFGAVVDIRGLSDQD